MAPPAHPRHGASPRRIQGRAAGGVALLLSIIGLGGTAAASDPFHVAADPAYSIVDSAADSVRFTLERTLRRDDQGHLVSISSFVTPLGEVMGWHDFGHLEGPGWAANAVGGAWEIWRWGRLTGRPGLQQAALAILDHVLDCGFIDEQTGFIRGYRETTTDRFCLNYKHRSDWFCPGSNAKVAFQLLMFAADLGGDRAARMRAMARRYAAWLDKHLEAVPNGWFPRRVTPEGRVYRRSPEGGEDPFWQTSADGLFIVQLQAALTAAGLADYREAIRRRLAVFRRLGGIYGSINHDTYDAHENVAYSVAFRTLRLAAQVLEDPALHAFALTNCLAGLEQFKMREDRHGVATRGLLYMERSWDTSYLWENAEAALAYFEAALDLRQTDPPAAERCERDGLSILRTAAKHHYGPYGFLTEGVDWNNHVGHQHHIDQAFYGAIRYTEPFLNNQHILEPTLFYLERLARRESKGNRELQRDIDGNLLWVRSRTEAGRLTGR